MKRHALAVLIVATVSACVAADRNDHETVVELVQHITRGKNPDTDFDNVLPLFRRTAFTGTTTSLIPSGRKAGSHRRS